MAAALRHSKEDNKTAFQTGDKKIVHSVFDKLLKQTAGHELPPNATIQKQLPTKNGIQIYIVGKPNGMPRAIYKFTNNPPATTSLLHHARTLKSQEKLFKSADLDFYIPEIYAVYQNNMTVGLFESIIPGITLQKFIQEKESERLPSIMADVSAKLGSFYGTQQSVINVVDEEINLLVDTPIDTIESKLGMLNRTFIGRKLLALRLELNGALSWQQLAFGPIHGDLSPNNIILDSITGEMIGLTNWEAAEQSGYPAVDLFHLILNVSAQMDHKEVGTAVVKALKQPRRFDSKAYLIADTNKLTAPNDSDRIVILLAWLQYLQRNLSKDTPTTQRFYWFYKNIVRVLAKL